MMISINIYDHKFCAEKKPPKLCEVFYFSTNLHISLAFFIAHCLQLVKVKYNNGTNEKYSLESHWVVVDPWLLSMDMRIECWSTRLKCYFIKIQIKSKCLPVSSSDTPNRLHEAHISTNYYCAIVYICTSICKMDYEFGSLNPFH